MYQFARNFLIIIVLSPLWLMLAAIALGLQSLHDLARVAAEDEDT